MHEVLVNRLGGLSLPRKSVVRLTERPDMTLDVYRGRKTTKQYQQQLKEKATMKLKVTNNISYLEAKTLHENKPETTFSKIVHSIARPEMKDASTQYKKRKIVKLPPVQKSPNQK